MYDFEFLEDLIISEFAGKISEAEQRLLDKAVAENAEVAALRERVRSVLSRPGAQKAVRELGRDFNLEQVKQREILEEWAQRALVRKRKLRRTVISAAAVLLVLLGAGTGLFWWSRQQNAVVPQQESIATGQPSLVISGGQRIDLSRQGSRLAGGVRLSSNGQMLTYQTEGSGAGQLATLYVPNGKDYQLRLSDGTEIQLNSGSSLTFPFTFNAEAREVTLLGEAYFQVAGNAQKPFLVHIKSPDGAAERAIVRVLGTAFNVNAYRSDHWAVSLVEGSIRLQHGADSALLLPGQEAVPAPGAETGIITRPFNRQEVLSWRSGVLEFNDKTLAAVFEALPRWYGVEIKIDDPSLEQIPFTGLLDRKRPITVLLDHLSYTHQVDHYYSGGVLHFRRGK